MRFNTSVHEKAEGSKKLCLPRTVVRQGKDLRSQTDSYVQGVFFHHTTTASRLCI